MNFAKCSLLWVLVSASSWTVSSFTPFPMPSTYERFSVQQSAVFASPTSTTSSPTSSTATTSQDSTSAAPLNIPDNVILYDGVCNFCNTWVSLLLRLDFQKKFWFAPLQSQVGQQLLVSIGKQADDISSVVLVKANGQSFDKSRCVLQVVQELGPGADVLAQAALRVVPESLRDSVYDTVAENRYNLMGKRDECRCSDPEFADRFLLD